MAVKKEKLRMISSIESIIPGKPSSRRIKSNEVIQGRTHKEIILENLKQTLNDWIKKIMFMKTRTKFNAEYDDDKLITPYGLNDNEVLEDETLNLVAFIPLEIERDEFLIIFSDKLKKIRNISKVFVIDMKKKKSYIKFAYDFIKIELKLINIDFKYLKKNIDFKNELITLKMDVESKRIFYNLKFFQNIFKLINRKKLFLLVYKIITFWAKSRGIYGKNFGYLGYIAWSILLAKIMQLYSDLSVEDILCHFYHYYDSWNWSKPVVLQEKRIIEQENSNFTSNYDAMQIIFCPYEAVNFAQHIDASSLDNTKAEIKRASYLINDIKNGKGSLKSLFQCEGLLNSYKYSVNLTLTSPKEFLYVWEDFIEYNFPDLQNYLKSQGNMKVTQFLTDQSTKEENEEIKTWELCFSNEQLNIKDTNFIINHFINEMKLKISKIDGPNTDISLSFSFNTHWKENENEISKDNSTDPLYVLRQT